MAAKDDGANRVLRMAMSQLSVSELPQDKKMFNQKLKQWGNSLELISGRDANNIVQNIIKIFYDRQIIVKGLSYSSRIKKTPETRLFIYKYLQKKINYSNMAYHLLRDLYHALINSAIYHPDDHTVEFLKVLHIFYRKRYHFIDLESVKEMFSRLFYLRDKHVNKEIYMVLDDIILNYYNERARTILMNEILALADFGNLEYTLAANLVKRIKPILVYVEKLMPFIMKGFADNNFAFSASILFNEVIRSTGFNSYNIHIKPIIIDAFSKMPDESSRTLATSFAKYIIITLGKSYRYEGLAYLEDLNIYYQLIGYKHIFIAMSYVKDRDSQLSIIDKIWDNDDSSLKVMAFELLCYFPNSKIKVTERDINLFKRLLFHLPEMNAIIRRNIRYFISQITIGYACSKEYKHIPLYLRFYVWIICQACQFAPVYSLDFCDSIVELFVYSLELLIQSPSFLVASYIPRLEYEVNPLAKLFGNYLEPIRSNLLNYLYIISKNSHSVCVARNILFNYFHRFLTPPDIILDLRNVIDLMSNNPVIRRKTIFAYQLLINRQRGRPDRAIVLEAYKNDIRNGIEHVLNTYRSAQNFEETENLEIASFVSLLSQLVDVLPKSLEFYARELHTSRKNLEAAVDIFPKYSMGNFCGMKEKTKKNLEASLIELINYYFKILKKMDYPKYEVHLFLMFISEMLRSVISKKVVTNVCENLQETIQQAPHCQHSYKELYLKEKEKYLRNPDVIVALRKSAQIRLIMHTLLKGIKSPYFLRREIETFIIACDTQETMLQLHLKLNLLETLMSDADLKKITEQYLVRIFEKGLVNSGHREAMIRNSSVQLVSVVSTRLLGPISETGKRELSANEAFFIYPELADVINNYLFCKNVTIDVKVSILSFLAECSYKGTFQDTYGQFNMNQLKELYLDGSLRYYAAKAFSACCPDIY